MVGDIYDPFESLDFSEETCFLTGEKLDGRNNFTVSAFPEWVMDKYKLNEAYLLMLSGTRLQYKELRMPASKHAFQVVKALDENTQAAFQEGFEAVKHIPDLLLFQWMARVFYGVLYGDCKQGIIEAKEKGQEFRMAPQLKRKFKNLHLMLQSLIRPVEFRNFTPWTICRYQVNISKDIFNYKDEIQHLNFSFGMKDFGIAACLQDNGAVASYHRNLLQKVEGQPLHPAQFEELYGHLVYANYLMEDFEDYRISLEDDRIVLELAENEATGSIKFAKWEDEIFAQVLTNMWQPWGIPLELVYRFPNSPLSYLINEQTNEFIPKERVELDY